jgi:hypothetical protein
MLLQNDDRMKALRQKLRAMTESGLQPYQHRVELQAVSQEIPNTIRVLGHHLAEDQYTCGMHALFFEGSEEYAEIAGHGLGLVYAGPDFFGWLIANLHLEEVTTPDNGDLVMYFRESKWMHVGRLSEPDRVISKWGLGLLCDHELAEVPEQYGEKVRFFRHPGPEASLDLFVLYAKDRGISFEESW